MLLGSNLISYDMKTTVEIPDELFQKVNSTAALEGIRFRDLVVQGLHLVMEQRSNSHPLHRANFPLIRTQDKSQMLTDETVTQALIEEDDRELQRHADFMRR